MDLNSYFKTLAEQHIDIAHSDDSDLKGYFRIFSSSALFIDNEMAVNIKYMKQNVIVSQFNDDSALPAPTNDYCRQSPNGSLFILSRIMDNNIAIAKSKALELRDDIYSRIKYDIRQGTILKNFVIENIQSQTIGRMLDNFFTVALLISYSENYNATYDVDKWQQSIS